MADMDAALAPSTVAEASARTPRILIVDDVSDNRAILARRFQRRGYEVVEATGGHEALALIAAQAFDLVLLDWMMADIDGPEVLRRIRADYAPAALPVIMATAKTQSEDIVEALGLGANDYITKPIDFAVALARAETQIGRKRAEEQVREANEALNRTNGELELRIAERTAELSKALEVAEAANRAKDQFLSTMSHELRTPLNGVIAMADLLRNTELSAGQAQMVGVIAQSGAALNVIVANLLDMVELRSGAVELKPTTFRLGELIAETAARVQPRAEGKGLALAVDIGPEVQSSVHADAARLRRALTDLLDNAVKFTAEGRIPVTARRQPASPDRVTIAVADTGVGFDPAQAERLFQPFQQADNSFTRAFGGAGLGLAISQGLVQQMGGIISADAKPGEGAVFRIELPLPPVAEAA